MKANTRVERKNELKELTDAIKIISTFITEHEERLGDEQKRYHYGKDIVKYMNTADAEKILNTPGTLKEFFTMAQTAINDIYYFEQE